MKNKGGGEMGQYGKEIVIFLGRRVNFRSLVPLVPYEYEKSRVYSD